MTFPSKRNRVFLAPDGVVVKVCQTAQAAAGEAAFLETLAQKGIAVPAVLGREESSLKLQYIKGLTIPDWLERHEAGNGCFDDLCGAVILWMEAFYSAVDHDRTKEIRGDVNGRNFILSDRLFGVDFETRAFGEKAWDVGRFAAYILAYDPSFTPYKRAFANAFLERACACLGATRRDAEDALKRELRDMKDRRAGFAVPAEFM